MSMITNYKTLQKTKKRNQKPHYDDKEKFPSNQEIEYRDKALFSIHSKKKPFTSELTQRKQILSLIHSSKDSSQSICQSSNHKFALAQYKNLLKGQKFYIEVYFKGKTIFSGYEPFIQAMGGEIAKRITNSTTIILTAQLNKFQYQKIKNRKNKACPSAHILSILWIQQIYRQKRKVQKQLFVIDAAKDIIDVPKQEQIYPQIPDYFHKKLIKQFAQNINNYREENPMSSFFQLFDNKKTKKNVLKIPEYGCIILQSLKTNIFNNGQYEKLRQEHKNSSLPHFWPKKQQNPIKKKSQIYRQKSQIRNNKKAKQRKSFNSKKNQIFQSLNQFSQNIEQKQQNKLELQKQQKIQENYANQQEQREFMQRIKNRAQSQNIQQILNKYLSKTILQNGKGNFQIQIQKKSKIYKNGQQSLNSTITIKNDYDSSAEQNNINVRKSKQNQKTKTIKEIYNDSDDLQDQNEKNSINIKNKKQKQEYPNHQNQYNQINKILKDKKRQKKIRINKDKKSFSSQTNPQNQSNLNQIVIVNKRRTRKQKIQQKYNKLTQVFFTNSQINKVILKLFKFFLKDIGYCIPLIQQKQFSSVILQLHDYLYVQNEQYCLEKGIYKINVVFSDSNSQKTNRFISDYNKLMKQKINKSSNMNNKYLLLNQLKYEQFLNWIKKSTIIRLILADKQLQKQTNIIESLRQQILNILIQDSNKTNNVFSNIEQFVQLFIQSIQNFRIIVQPFKQIYFIYDKKSQLDLLVGHLTFISSKYLVQLQFTKQIYQYIKYKNIKNQKQSKNKIDNYDKSQKIQNIFIQQNKKMQIQQIDSKLLKSKNQKSYQQKYRSQNQQQNQNNNQQFKDFISYIFHIIIPKYSFFSTHNNKYPEFSLMRSELFNKRVVCMINNNVAKQIAFIVTILGGKVVQVINYMNSKQQVDIIINDKKLFSKSKNNIWEPDCQTFAKWILNQQKIQM